MREPGDLTTLDRAGLAAWNDRIERCLAAAILNANEGFVLSAPDDRTPHVIAVDWLGFPARVATCLTRQQAHELVDWDGDTGNQGRLCLQEEYLEWRVVRDTSSGAIRRVEFTTELADYWRVMAAYDPVGILATVGQLAGEEAIAPDAVYAGCDPFAEGVTPHERERAFAGAMLPPDGRSPYNTGLRAICCMIQPTNTLPALVGLVAAAAAARQCRDTHTRRLRRLTAAEAIALFPDVAQQARASDPVLVECLGRLAFEGRHIAFDDPLGLYIVGIEQARLRTPDGSAVPCDWFALSRGVSPNQAVDGRPRFQHLTFEVPREHGFSVSDLVDVATGQPIRFGGQIAELVQVAVYVRAGPTGIVPTDPCLVVQPAEPGPDANGCAEVRRHFAARIAQHAGGDRSTMI